jgi:hypothetical protein
MKRLIFAGAVIALVCAASGSATAWHGEKSIVAARKNAATRSARHLLHEFVPPTGARRIHAGPNYGHQSVGVPFGESVDIRRFWISHATASAAVAFEKAHVPAGFSYSGGGRNSDGTRTTLMFDSPPHGVATRILAVAISQRKTRTIVRADAQVVWVYPRSPQEVVPAGVREIDVKSPHVNRRVTDPAAVAKIVRWFNRLPLSPPGQSAPCGPIPVTPVSLVFRSAHGSRVASANVPSPRAGICAAIDFAIHGKPQLPLIDNPRGVSFASRLQDVLGVRFRPPHY